MTSPFAVTEAPLATPLPSDPLAPTPWFFDPAETILSEYAQSPVIRQIIAFFAQWLDPASRFDAYYRDVRDIMTAGTYGLDVWGRILNVSRVLAVPDDVYLGFAQDTNALPFGFGIWYSGGRSSANVALTNDAYRTLLLAKAALNITNASAPAVNAILLALFGQGYVEDNGDMTIVYHFDDDLTPVQTAIIYQSGVLPKPAGVSFTVENP